MYNSAGATSINMYRSLHREMSIKCVQYFPQNIPQPTLGQLFHLGNGGGAHFRWDPKQPL